MLPILFKATYETLKFTFTTSIFVVILGIPLGVLLEATSNQHILGNKYLWVHTTLKAIINFLSNIPIFLMLIILIPIINGILFEYFTIELSAIIALVFICTCIFAKDVFNSLNNLPKELSDTAKFLGAESLQVLTKFLLPEAKQHLINNITKLIINLISLSIMVSMLGINGLGKLALEKGYNEADLSCIFYIILLSTSIIYIIKFIGNLLSNYFYNKQHNAIIS